jgi:hypothetical protein
MDVNQVADNIFNRLDIDNILSAGVVELHQAIGVINRLFLTHERAARLDAIRTLLQRAIDRQNNGRISPAPAAGGRRRSRKNRH